MVKEAQTLILRNALIVVMLCMFSLSAKAFVITADQAYFQSLFSDSSKHISFENLKDGTSYVDATVYHPFINNITHTIGGRYEVWEQGWTDDYLIRSTNGSLFHLVTRWDGSSIGINSASAQRLSLLALSELGPVSLNITSATYSGFIGIIPESGETHFQLYYPDMRVHDLFYGYRSVSEPGMLLILIIGAVIGMFGLKPFRKRNMTGFMQRKLDFNF